MNNYKLYHHEEDVHYMESYEIGSINDKGYIRGLVFYRDMSTCSWNLYRSDNDRIYPCPVKEITLEEIKEPKVRAIIESNQWLLYLNIEPGLRGEIPL